MHESHSKVTGWMVGIILLAVGLVAGIGIGKTMDNGDKSSGSSSHAHMISVDSKAADLRSELVRLGTEHMMLTDAAVADTLDGSPAASATAKNLYQNGTDLGAAIGSVYGKDAEKTFNDVWKLHLDQFVAYAVASSKHDENDKATALSTIDGQYTKPLAQYLAKANPNLDEATLESSLREHVQMTAKMIDYHVSGDYAKEADQLDMSSKHLEGLMSALAGAIVKQFPQKFES